MKNSITKRVIYIGAFIVLGILLQQLVHAVIELVVIQLLVADFVRYGLGLSWANWLLVHRVGSLGLWLVGIWFGWQQGRHWWQVLYVEGRRFRWRR